MCSKYIKALRALRLDAKEELKEKTLEEQLQENKMAGIWAKGKLKTEQQIATKQTPLQRARRICNKRQEEIDRKLITEHKTCEKRLTIRLSYWHSTSGPEGVKSSLPLPEENISEISLPKLPEMYMKRNSLPPLSHSSPPTLSCNNKSSSLPTIIKQLPSEVFCVQSQPLSHLNLPPLKV